MDQKHTTHIIEDNKLWDNEQNVMNFNARYIPDDINASLRRSYSKDVANNAFKGLGFVNYLDIEANKLNLENRIIISLEFLHKLHSQNNNIIPILSTFKLIFLNNI